MEGFKESGRITRESIATALLLLMEEKDYEKITISEITEKAGVSRMAYYRNYKDKDDILVNFLRELSLSVSDAFAINEDTDLYSIIKGISEFFKANVNLIFAISKTGRITSLFNDARKWLTSYFPELASDEEARNLYIYHSGGVISVFENWFRDGMDKSPEEIADMICEFMGKDIIQRFNRRLSGIKKS